MLNEVRKTISRNNLLERGDIVCVAVSGGIDSTVLLHLLNSLKDELSLTLIVCHLNHGLRGRESERDERFVKKIAKELEMNFYCKRLSADVIKSRKGEGLQAWARKRRREFLFAAAKKYNADKIALGHTLDDQAETVLMRFIKGASLDGLTGMRYKNGQFIRPLLDCSRKEIERYAKDQGIVHVVDSTNLKTKYLRNSIRLKLMPFIEKRYNPNIKETIKRTSVLLKRDKEYLNELAVRAFARVVKESGAKTVLMDRVVLSSLHKAIIGRVFLKAIGCLGIYTVSSGEVESFLGVIFGKKPNAVVKLLKGLYVQREYDTVAVSKEKPLIAHAGFKKKLLIPGETSFGDFIIKASVLNRAVFKNLSRTTSCFDYEKLKTPVIVRTFKQGDRMQPLGMKGHRKLKDIFIDEKIPIAMRRSMPLIEADGEIIWLCGIRQGDGFKLGDTTQKVLKIELSAKD